MEKLYFRKYPQLVKLDTKHGVSVCTNYITETVSKEFTHYITESVRARLCLCLSAAKYFSLSICFNAQHNHSKIPSALTLLGLYTLK